MMLRWQFADYAMATLGGIEEVTVLGVWGIDAGDVIPPIEIPGDHTYVVRRSPLVVALDEKALSPARVVVVVRFAEGGTPVVYELHAAAVWLLDDQADTIDRIR